MLTTKNEDLPAFLKGTDTARWTGRWHVDRRVFLMGEMNPKSLEVVALELLKLEEDSNEPITLMIRSGGGDVMPSFQLQDVITALHSPVDALVIGNCASMAVDLVQTCRKRMALPSVRMLLHYVRSGQEWICDDLDQLDNDYRLFRERAHEIAKRRMDLYTKRTGMSPDKLKEIMRHGEVHKAHISAQQALELKLIDEIVTDFKFFPNSKKD